ncbi:hypothetical protein TNCV_3046181 [Trichonephila clavipes]|uniref:Uncharacterized protein n=1 Tax=Trichonephila clavipes TaxID=2585209 RepID=A0A8X6RP13_TRICX|nr:hypothetical protein TNCV_3046181 [Trichonephila clavipes]
MIPWNIAVSMWLPHIIKIDLESQRVVYPGPVIVHALTSRFRLAKDHEKKQAKKFKLVGKKLLNIACQLNLALKESILPQLKRFRQKWRISRSAFRKPRFRTLTSNNSTECISEWILKGTILNVILSWRTYYESSMT